MATKELGFMLRLDQATPAEQMPSLSLAYIGDVVFELMIRQYLLAKGMVNVNKLHKTTVKFVNASAQAKVMRALMPSLEGVEADVARRGRNVKSRPPKNMDPGDYAHATALECLVGYYYLTQKWDKLDSLFGTTITLVEERGAEHESKTD